MKGQKNEAFSPHLKIEDFRRTSYVFEGTTPQEIDLLPRNYFCNIVASHYKVIPNSSQFNR